MKKITLNEFDREIWTRHVSLLEEWLNDYERDWSKIATREVAFQFDAYVARAELCLRQTLYYWRGGEDPVPPLLQALDFARTALDLAKTNGVDNPVARKIFIFIWLSQAASLIGLNFELPPYSIVYKKSGKNDWLKLNPYIYKRLKGISTDDRVDSLIDRVTERKYQFYIDNYRTYEAILDHHSPSHKSFDALVREAEANYHQRGKDRFYGDSELEGGGYYNPYVRDLTLAVILKKKRWTGKSDHQWPW